MALREDVASLPLPMRKGGVFLNLTASWAITQMTSPHMLMTLSVLSPANLLVVTLLNRLEPSGEKLIAWDLRN